MKALDSNIVLRLLLADDPVQTPLAEKATHSPCWISLTVLLEVAWVLGSRYQMTRADIATVLRSLDAYETVEIEGRRAAFWAIDRYEKGGDIADLLHVAAARDAQTFATFDREISRAAGSNPPVSIETLS